MAVTPDRALWNDHASAPGEWNLAKTVFDSEVMRQFMERTQIWDLIQKKPFTGAKTEEFILVADDGVAYPHEPGSEIEGQNIEKSKRNISLEDREAISYYNISQLDKFISHYDLQSQMGINAGNALAALCENHAIRAFALAANTSASGAFKGGQVVTRTNTGSCIGGASGTYPLTLTGSQKFQADIGEMVQDFREDHISGREMYLFTSPYMMRVLRCDNSLLSADYVGREYADKINGKLTKVENVWCMESMYMPTAGQETTASTSVTNANWSSDVAYTISGTGAYQVDLRKLVAIVVIPGAAGGLVAENITSEIEKIPGTRSWNIGVAMLKGLGTLRPELAGKIDIS
jgi:hypothetical protein